MSSQKPRTFLLVHGAWGGAWAVSRLARRLRNFGHPVFTPSLAGLGERYHGDEPRVTLSTHAEEVAHLLRQKDLRGVVLVGCSYGGMVITAAAELATDRLAGLAYIDAFVPRDGESIATITGRAYPAPMVKPPASYTGKVVPQSRLTFTEKVHLTGALAHVPRKVYVHATGWDGPFGETVRALKADTSWTVVDMDSGHDIANERPDELAHLLHDFF